MQQKSEERSENELLNTEINTIFKKIFIKKTNTQHTKNMQFIIKQSAKWKNGNKKEWISKFSVMLSILPRSIREDYVEPLIDFGILKEEYNDIIFVGLSGIDAQKSESCKVQ